MKPLLIICAIITAVIGLIVLAFYIKLKIENRKSGYRVKLNEICYEDEEDFNYKKIKRNKP